MPSGPPVAGASPPPAADTRSPAPRAEAGRRGLLADEAANRRLVATTAAVALVLVALMIGLLLMSLDDGETAVPDPGPPPPATPTVTESRGSTAGAIDDAALDALVLELQAVVEEERGLAFREELDVELLDDSAYIERSRADFEADLLEDPEDLQNAVDALGALGLWPEGVDPVEVLGQYQSVGSLGYYDPETGELVVRGTQDTPNLRITLVHELAHALDDQHFELDRPALEDRPDEAAFAFSALVEGSASRIESAYTDSLTDEQRAEAEAEQQGYIDGIDVSAFPPILLAREQFVYRTGADFVRSIYEVGGDAAVNRALRRPPTTSEQILEPADWPERETVAAVPPPEADGEIIEASVVGQFLIHALASLSEDEPTPEWDGDNSVLWRDGDRDCLRMAVAGDVEALMDGLTPWAEQVGADLEVDDDLLVVTSCR